MKYNLTPLTIGFEDTPWPDRLHKFFYNENYDPVLRDWYYDCLIRNVDLARHILTVPYLIDSYTGTFTFLTPETDGHHSFNLAYWMQRNYIKFSGKKVLTLTADYGILNITSKFVGLEVTSFQKPELNVGTVLTCIGNGCSPYIINHETFDFSVIMACCVFTDETVAWNNWNFMLDEKIKGKDVYFTSNSFVELRKYINYDHLEQVEDPKSIYLETDYADISYGYMNKIYRLR